MRFFYDYKVDDDQRLTHCIWVDGISRQDYLLFGAAITFNTTYKINQYLMIFVAFCSFNHHRQTVFFGSALLINETKESFVWIFNCFKECMGKNTFFPFN